LGSKRIKHIESKQVVKLERLELGLQLQQEIRLLAKNKVCCCSQLLQQGGCHCSCIPKLERNPLLGGRKPFEEIGHQMRRRICVNRARRKFKYFVVSLLGLDN